MTHHPCGRSSYSTSSTGLSSPLSRRSSSRDASIKRSAVPTRISVLGHDVVKGINAPETSGSVRDTPELPMYAFPMSTYADTLRISLSACASAWSLGWSDTRTAPGAMAIMPRGGGLPDCRTRWANTIAIVVSVPGVDRNAEV